MKMQIDNIEINSHLSFREIREIYAGRSKNVEIVNDDSISTCADQIRIVYRIHNGRRQKRRWNQTQGEWVDKKWIDLGPA